MGSVIGSKRTLAAILIVIIAVSVTGVSTYAIMNNQKFSQQNYLLSLVLLQIGPSRIVSLAPNIDEILSGLGLEDYIVGCTNNDPYGYGITMQDYYYPPRIIELILAGKIDNSLNWYYPSVESVLAINPSVVLLDAGVPSQIQLYSNLISRGIVSLLVSPGRNFDEIENSIKNVSRLFGRDLAAQTLVNAMNTKINNVKNNVSGQAVLKVLFVADIDFGKQSLWTCGNYTFQSEIINSAGGLNIFYDVYDTHGFFQKSFADVLDKNPDVIIISSTYYIPATLLDNIAKDSILRQTTAYINNSIYFVQQQADNIFSRAGPRVAETVELLAHILHPLVFGNTSPDHIINTFNYHNYTGSLIIG